MQAFTDIRILWSAVLALPGVAAVILCILLFSRLRRFSRPFDALVEAAKTSGVADLLQAQLQAVDANARRLEETLAYVRHLRVQTLNAIQGIGFKRYDAFDDIRGQQSFSLCLVDAHLNGVMITSIAGRSDSRAYAKPIHEGRCEMALSGEEVQVLAMAQESLGEVHEPVLAGV